MYLYRFLRVDSSIRNKGYMRNCKTCGKFINNSRLHLGYKECIRCSDVEKYSAHIVYPHKTGGYVQPVSSTTKKHLDSIDRRSSTGNKTVSGTGSWDRWLKNYQKNKNVQVPKRSRARIANPKLVSSTLTLHSVMPTATSIFISKGYHEAVKYINTLFDQDKISLITKSSANNKLTFIHSHNKKEQKIILKKVKKSMYFNPGIV